MHYSLLFTIFSFIYVGMLFIAYLGRKKVINNLRAKIFTYLFFAIISYLVFQIASVTVLYNYHDGAAVKTLWRLSWGSCILWYSFYYFYAVALMTKANNTSFFKFCFSRKIYIIMFIIFSLGLIAYLFILPYAGLDINDMTYLPGKTAYIVWGFCLVITIVMLIQLFRNKKNMTKSEIFTIAGSSLFFTTFGMGTQVYLHECAIIPFAFCLEMYYLFVTAENPDLVLLEESKKVKKEVDEIDSGKRKLLYNIMSTINKSSAHINNNIINLNGNITQKSIDYNLNEICNNGINFLEKTNALYNLYNINNMALNEINYSLSDLLNKISNETINKIGSKQIKFYVNVDPKIPTSFVGDYEKIHQILLNLLTNAAIYTSVGRIMLNVNGKLGSEGYELKFSVSDTGEGIKDDKGDLLNIDKDNNDLKGFGLLICKEYINFLNGSISYDTHYKVGTTFVVTLTQKVGDNTPIGEFKFLDNYTNDISVDYNGKTILIVDDNINDIKIFKRYVKKCNFKIVECSSADESINHLKSDEKFDIIFIDDVMPEMGGVEALSVIKALANPCPPVIITTSNSFPGIEKFYKDKGFSEYLSKPYDKHSLEKILHKYL